jgi:hypothetical protein
VTAERVLAAVRARGSDARDVRDAAHEASHALQFRLPNWNRTLIDLHMHRVRPAARVRSEVIARAVEQLVCERVGFPYDPAEFISVALLEMAMTFRDVEAPTTTVFTASVREALAMPTVRRLVDKIVGMGGS